MLRSLIPLSGAAAAVAVGAATIKAHAEVTIPQETYQAAFPKGTKEVAPKQTYEDWDSNWDGMSPPKEATPEFRKRFNKAPTRHIILIRHGQYDLDFKGDPPLTDLGREQAALAGKYLANASVTSLRTSPSSKQRNVIFKKVHSSDVCRARQTAEIIAKELVTAPYLAAEEPLLQVADPMLAEGAAYPVDHSSWRPDPSTFFQDGARIEAAFRKYFHRSTDGYRAWRKELAAHDLADDGSSSSSGEQKSYAGEDTYELVVCHGNVIRYCLLRALQMPPGAWLRLASYNCGLTHIEIRASGNVSVYGFGDVGFLPLDKITYH